MINKTRIPWADYTWNPVTGCCNNCPYCYARKIARRFGKTEAEKWFLPTFHPERLDIKFPTDRSIIFVNSMSDPLYWTQNWISSVLEVIQSNPLHSFVFLTKGGFNVYRQMNLPSNVIAGITVTNMRDMPNLPGYRSLINQSRCKWLLNIEPLHGDLAKHPKQLSSYFDWLIIGAETGNRKDRIIPNWDWVDSLVYDFALSSVPVFIKPSMKEITPQHLYLQQRII